MDAMGAALNRYGVKQRLSAVPSCGPRSSANFAPAPRVKGIDGSRPMKLG
jgi:hypothetical protein